MARNRIEWIGDGTEARLGNDHLHAWSSNAAQCVVVLLHTGGAFDNQRGIQCSKRLSLWKDGLDVI
jgi:hypothetical protein